MFEGPGAGRACGPADLAAVRGYMIGGLVVVGAIYAYGTAPKAVVVESSPAEKA